MKRNPRWTMGLAACSLLVVTGCTAPQAAVRGQSHHTTQVGPVANGNLTTVQGAFHDQHSQHVSYHSTTGIPGYSSQPGPCPNGACPPGYGAPCPPGHGPAMGGGCPTGACGAGCGPQHYHSYSYSRPNNLVYPQAEAGNVPGGAVVYPYYTHRGPSDFFRKDGNLCGCSR